jgi:hypothetical protein
LQRILVACRSTIVVCPCGCGNAIDNKYRAHSANSNVVLANRGLNEDVADIKC